MKSAQPIPRARLLRSRSRISGTSHVRRALRHLGCPARHLPKWKRGRPNCSVLNHHRAVGARAICLWQAFLWCILRRRECSVVALPFLAWRLSCWSFARWVEGELRRKHGGRSQGLTRRICLWALTLSAWSPCALAFRGFEEFNCRAR
jgi:hypothetical protein